MKWMGWLVLILLSTGACAWMEETHELICRDAVVDVWGGETAYQCLTDMDLIYQKRFCMRLSDGKMRGRCLNLSDVVHPAYIMAVLSDDREAYKDYSVCPIHMKQDRKYLCGNKSVNFAGENAKVGFSRAAAAKDRCEGVYYFCVGSYYIASSHNPLNRIPHPSANNCSILLEKKVEEKIASGEKNWMTRVGCKFEYKRVLVGQNRTSKYNQEFKVTEKTIERIEGDLVDWAKNISLASFVKTTSTSSSSTTSISSSTVSETTSTQPAVVVTTTLSEGEPRDEGGGVCFLGFLLKVFVVVAVLLVVYYLIKNKGAGGESSSGESGGGFSNLGNAFTGKRPTSLEK